MFYVFSKAVPPDICEQITRDCKQNTLEEAKVFKFDKSGRNNPSIRKSSVCFIRDKDDKINKLVWDFLRKANEAQFNYDLKYFQAVQFAEYKVGDFFGWHQDQTGISPSNEIRKLSATLVLSDPDTFEGGELQFYNGGRPMYTSKKDLELTENDMKAQGSLIIFDSRDWHRVTPVTKGVRYSVVCWSSGQAFR